MNCEETRQRITEDPAHPGEDVTRHVAGCAPCRAFAARAAEAERRILAALRVDVAALRDAHGRHEPPSDRRRTLLAAVAGAVLAGVAVWLGVGAPGLGGRGNLAEEVALHWYEEPESWTRASTAVTPVVLAAALDGRAEVDLGVLGTVTYARSCLVAGEWVPHLVVQGEEGPVMVLLLPRRAVSGPMPLSLPEEALEGRLVPHGDGSIAVLGVDGESLEEIERRAARAVTWTT